jgi:DNA-binding response OmpR family regulator
MSESLAGAGLVVIGELNARDALSRAAAATEPPAVLVTDIRLGPGMDGIALAREACRRWPGLGVVFVTGYEFDHARYRLGPLERFLAKPFGGQLLVGTVQDLLRRARPQAGQAGPPSGR